ncbi:MAG: hypothetical protein J7M21_01785 [Planctomycetes bacterium]|nr:hypothetical protein [Planctomycetota bacterium]
MWVLQPCRWCGRTHLVWKQERTMSCGIACMMMAIQRTGKLRLVKARLHKRFSVLKKLHDSQSKPHPHPTEDELRVASKYHRGGYRPARSDVSGLDETNQMNRLVNELKGLNGNWTHTGITDLANVAATLNALGVAARFKRVGSAQAAMGMLTKARWGRPIVAGARRTTGGAHAVFVDCAKPLPPKNKPSKSKLLSGTKSTSPLTWRVCICDPDGSLVHVDIPPKAVVGYPGGQFTREFVLIG